MISATEPKTYRLLGGSRIRSFIVIGALFVGLPLAMLVAACIRGQYDAAVIDGVLALGGILIVLGLWYDLDETLEISDSGLILRHRFHSVTMSWDKITSVQLIRTSVSFTVPRRYVISALVRDAEGHSFTIHGKHPQVEEITETFRERVPHAVTEQQTRGTT
jgi:hypothetical protein